MERKEKKDKEVVWQGIAQISSGVESQFSMGSKIRYGDEKTLQRLLRNACFPKEKKQKNGTDTEKLWP